MQLPKGGRYRWINNTVTLVNNAALNENIYPEEHGIIGRSKRVKWFLIAGRVENGDDVARGVSVRIYKRTNMQNLFQLLGVSVNAGQSYIFPYSGSDADNTTDAIPLLVDSENFIRITWAAGGASAGGESEYSFYIYEVESDGVVE